MVMIVTYNGEEKVFKNYTIGERMMPNIYPSNSKFNGEIIVNIIKM